MRELSLSVHPNREVRLNIGPSMRRGKKTGVWSSEGEWLEIGHSEGMYCYPSLNLTLERNFNATPQVQESKPGWGGLPKESRFGTDQRRAMLRAGAIVDKYAKGRQVLLTGTLPGSTNEANFALACWSGYAVNRLQQWLRRITPSMLNFAVWEYQRRGALHLHYCATYETEEQKQAIMDGFKPMWFRILSDISAKSGVDVFEREDGSSWADCMDAIQADSQQVERSVAAYFSKYASKGYHADVSAEMDAAKLTRFCPSRWIVLSRQVSRLIAEHTWKKNWTGFSAEIAQKFDELHYELSADCIAKHSYEWKNVPGKTYIFYFDDERFEQIKAYIARNFMQVREDFFVPNALRKLIMSDNFKRKMALRGYGYAIVEDYLDGKYTEERQLRAFWNWVEDVAT